MQDMLYQALYYIYILIFAVYASLRIACGTFTAKTWRVFAGLCPALLLLQGLCLQLWGMEMVWKLYPLITHLPIVLVFILLMKIRWNMAIVSLVISYSFCQLPRWAGLVIEAFGLMPAAGLVLHLAVSQGILLLLSRCCLGTIHNLLASFHRPLRSVGALPTIYYLYEYFMIYAGQRFIHVQALNEFLPTGFVLFFILFVIAYQREMEKRALAERQNAALGMELDRAEQEMTMLRMVQEQTAIYRHDMHHHLRMIDGLLSTGRQDQALSYIRDTQNEIDAIAPMRCCENETVNLLLGAFRVRAEAKAAVLSVKAVLPEKISLPDTELCTLLSNGLENALNAVAKLPEGAERKAELYCAVKQNKLLIEICNAYAGALTIKDGLPQSVNPEHGYGCRSIQSIVQRRQGVCSFDAAQGIFTLRIAIPLK